MEKKTAVSYCRKSVFVKGLSEEESIHYQKESIERFAEQNEIVILHHYHDVGYSGKNANRPELQKMLYDLETGKEKVDILLFYSVDRLGRDLESNITIMLEITKYVEHVMSVSEQLSNGVEYFKTFFLLLTSQAQTERDKLLYKTAAGRRAKILNRKSFDASYLPLGYVKVQGRESIDRERLVPATEKNTDSYDEIQGLKMVHFIFHSYLFGMSLREIADKLNQTYGITRRKTKWSHKSVRYILSNQIYIGSLKGILNRTENYYIESANVEPIVNPVVFELIQKRLEIGSVGRKSSSNDGFPLFHLCRVCASPLTKKGMHIQCSVCDTAVDGHTLRSVITQALENTLKRNKDTQPFIGEVKKRYKWKQKNLEKRIQDLESVYTTILEMGEEHTFEHAKKKMLQLNTNEITTFRQELQHVKAFLHLFNHYSSFGEDIENRSSLFSDYLVKLPYLALVDIEGKEVEFIFYEKPMNVNVGDNDA